MQPYRLKLPIYIRFKDFDTLKHVNNANFHTYLEQARIGYFEKVLSRFREVDWWKDGIIIARMEIDFKKPITGYLDYYVSICVSRIGNKSFDFRYLITHESGDLIETIAEATSVMACYDYEKKQTIPVYDEWVLKMEEFEEKKLRS